MNPTVPGRTYYPALDVLRGIAILLVFFYHNFHFLPIFQFGWMGVDLFFVLSGFLITEILLSSQKEKNYFRNFYARRFLRISPLYYLTLFAFLCLSPYLFSEQNMGIYHYYTQNQVWFWSHLQNWLFVQKGLSSTPYLSHFWSLAVEEQFYLFWPLIIFLLKDLKRLRICIIALIIAALAIRIYMWHQYPSDMVKYYCNTLTRMDSLLMGCLLLVWQKEGKSLPVKKINYTILFCVSFLITGFLLGNDLKQTNPFFSTIGYTVISVLCASLLYLFIKGEVKPFNWLKTSSLLNYIGKISYGIYIFHIPVHLVLSSVLMNILRNNLQFTATEALLSVATISLIVTIVAGSLSFYLLEKPLSTLKKHFQ